MNASDLFVKALENEGVEFIFGLPGEENIDFLNALTKSSIKFIVTRHEQAAGFMAATYGRLTGCPGVVLSTLGPGATNLMTAVAYAHLGGMPIFILTGQKPIQENEQMRFQLIDVVAMMKPVTKFSKQASFSTSIPAMVREAFKISTQERPGAVHVELPEDVAQEEVEVEIFPVIFDSLPVANEDAILQAVDLIRSAKNPLILIGASANRPGVHEALEKFIALHGFYFFNTQLGKGVVDERSPYYLGTAALSKDDFIHAALSEVDLIINVGHDVVEKPPFLMGQGDQKVIHLDYGPAKIDQEYYPQLSVVGDIATSIDHVSAGLDLGEKKSFPSLKAARVQIKELLSRYDEDDRFPILPQRLVNIVRNILEADDVVTLDNGMYILWFARHYCTYKPNTLLLDNALASMGAGLPSAIAAKLLHHDKKVVSISGDGGFMMNSQELETAVRLQLDLIIIVLRDNAYGMIRWKQESMGFENYGLDFGNPDFVKYAESYGVSGYRPDSVAAFEDTFHRALHTSGIHLIDLEIDYSLNQHLGKDA